MQIPHLEYCNNCMLKLLLQINNPIMKFLLIFAFFLININGHCQKEKTIISLPITSYLQVVNDTLTIVQVKLPAFSVFDIEEKTLGVLLHKYESNKDYDTARIGYGRCNLTKGSFNYFGLHLYKNQQPQEGDILKLKVVLEDCYKGLLYTASTHHILFTTVERKEFYNWQTPFLWKTETEEKKFYTMMINDIKYTGKAMLQQMPTQNKEIESGTYKGVKLFDVMQNITIKDLKGFLMYVKARPEKYTCNTWKISELYATWIDGGAPTVVE